MIERDGDRWISVKEAAAQITVCRETLKNRLRAAGVEMRAYNEPRRGPAGAHIRVSDWEAFPKPRRRPTLKEVPPHLLNVLLPGPSAAKILNTNRMRIWRLVEKGELPGCLVAGLGCLVQLFERQDLTCCCHLAAPSERWIHPAQWQR